MHARLTRGAVFVAALTTVAAAQALADVRINEIRIDQPGTDNDEYFELTGTPGESLSGLTYIVIGDGSAAQGSGVIEAVIPLTGKSIAADGFFLVTELTWTSVFAPGTPDYTPTGANPLNFENDDNVTHLLVRNFTGTNGQDLDANDDGVLDVTPWTEVVDSVALVKSLASVGTERYYSTTIVGPDGVNVPGHALRLPDATGLWQIGNFNGGEDTPGATNALLAALNLTIHEIQGATHTSPYASKKVRTHGIVTVKTSNGFFIQEAVGDGDPATSDGVFVFTNSAPTVSVGADVQVEGVVNEFTPGGASSGNLSNTEILPLPAAGSISTLSTGNALPAPVVIGSGGRLPPKQVIEDDALATFDPAQDGLDFWESLEGMRVLVAAPAVVAPTNQFGEIWVLADGGAGATGVNPRGGITLTQTDFNPERLQVQVGDEGILPGFDPQVQVGDRLSDVVGVMDYDFGQFQVLASETFTVTAGPLAPETTALVPTQGGLTVATANCQNLDPNDADGDADVADGKFGVLAHEIVVSLGSPDVVALEEIQDDSGSVDDGVVGSNLTLQTLVDAIAAAGGPGYQFAYVSPADGTSGGQPGGNIRVAFIWNPARTALVPGSLRSISDPNLGDGDAFQDSRRPLLGRFAFNGRRLTVIANHFTSKGGSTPLFGRVQPPVNGGFDQRTAEAVVVRAEVDAILAADPLADVVVAGDLNEFGWLAPLTTLEGSGPTALSNLMDTHPLLERYTYVFEGNSQALDHMLVSAALAAGAEHDIVHVNAEFANQASDHDPQVARLALPPFSAEELLEFFDAAVAHGDLTGVSSSAKKAAKELDNFRKRLELVADKESKGNDQAEISQILVALKEIDGDSSPPDSVTGAAVPRLVEILRAMLAGLSN
jgi:hypothetical protein